MAHNPRLQYRNHGQKRPTGTGGRPERFTERDRRRRRWSQNFLYDPAAIRQVVAASLSASTPTLIVEVGAGEGHLTAALAASAEQVVAYEIDPVLVRRLRQRYGERDNVRLVRADFLATSPPPQAFGVVGNIPYASTSRIVDWCLRARTMTSATLVTQLEYGRKRTGGFGRWSKLTVASWPRVTWRLGARIGREKFRPVPAVDSAILSLERRPAPALPESSMPAYRHLVDVGFTGVGGSLRASLLTEHPRASVDRALELAAVRPDSVVAFVHPDQWLTVFRSLHGLPGTGR
jgi:23S rRNA (adenine-N6)-dimethyltransferase